MTTLRCPICRRSFDSDQSQTMPFCSERCLRIDLHRWLNEAYGLPYEADESPKVLDEKPDQEE